MGFTSYQFVKGKNGQPDRVVEESQSDNSDPYSLRFESSTGTLQARTGFINDRDEYEQEWTPATQRQITAFRERTGWSGTGPLTTDRDAVATPVSSEDILRPGIRLMGDIVIDPYDMNRDGIPDWWHDPAVPRSANHPRPVVEPIPGWPPSSPAWDITGPIALLPLPEFLQEGGVPWWEAPPAQAAPTPPDDPGQINPSQPIRPYIDDFFRGGLGQVRMGDKTDRSGHVLARRGGIVFGTLPKVILSEEWIGKRRNG